MSKNFGGADGLTHTAYLELAEILGKKYEARFVSAEKLVSDFRSRRVASEIAIYGEAGELSYTIAERGVQLSHDDRDSTLTKLRAHLEGK